MAEKRRQRRKPAEDEMVEYIGYKLEGEDARIFREFKKKLNLRNNAEVGRKALFDQMRAEGVAA